MANGAIEVEARASLQNLSIEGEIDGNKLNYGPTKAVDREFFRLLPKGGTYIPAKADLNSIEYIKVGNYYNSSNAESGTIKNTPIQYNNAFIMYVLSPLSEVYDNESTSQWVYRLRIFITYTGNGMFVQGVFSDATPGNFNYGPWVKMTNSNDLGAVSKIINDHIANKSNPHAVTKAQVGLGSVANIDQSKAIKSITRSGTTFTATALDGTKTTFTQQDSNTTYSIATTSADGLMSKSDKAKLDGISSSAGSNVVATESADGLMSAADKTKLDSIDPSAITTNAANIKKNADEIVKLNSAIAEYRLMINPETGHMALAHYTKED